MKINCIKNLVLLLLLCSVPVLANNPTILKKDWILDPSGFDAKVIENANNNTVELTNGLVRRVFRISPNAATVALENLMTGANELRSVRPEALLTIDGRMYEVGGLIGQPIQNFLLEDWIDKLKANPLAFELVDYKIGKTTERFPWKKHPEWMSQDLSWPPKGVSLTFNYKAGKILCLKADSSIKRPVLISDKMVQVDKSWEQFVTSADKDSTFTLHGVFGSIRAHDHSCVFAERKLPAGTRVVQCLVEPGTDSSCAWGPGLALLWDKHGIKFGLRPGQNCFSINSSSPDSFETLVNYYAGNRPYYLRIELEPGKLVCSASIDAQQWETVLSKDVSWLWTDPKSVRIGKMSHCGGNNDHNSIGEIHNCKVSDFIAMGDMPEDEKVFDPDLPIANLDISVHYELYDGIPLMSKWVELKNNSKKTVRLNSFTAEILAMVESTPKLYAENPVELIDRFTPLHVVTDYAFGGDMEAMKDNDAVFWEHDHPEYEKTGIRYYGLYHPCRLICRAPLGPELDIASGGNWQSFRVFELLQDSTDLERRGLQRRKMWRTIAPWSQENPIFMHVRSARPEAVKLAIDQCAEVGFEMVIMTFWSGFQAENSSPEYLAQIKELADYAKSRGIALGGYSLLASRGGKPENLVIDVKSGKPGGAKFGASPCLCSDWGLNYFDTLRNLFNETGLNVFEHDGSYPGDKCASTDHLGHRSYEDSQWKQWEQIRDFYRWCRSQGIYLNVPDWYFLNGSSKTAMGYVETNWSLPREYQEIIERQNIFDGTFDKTASMGWMFVPLTQYHGGGAAATIEPLKEHLDHYETRLRTLFTSGVQAAYRGPRLYDAPETMAVVSKWVDFYKKHRQILDSDIIHLRRPDGGDIDYIMHVNPSSDEKGLLVIHNPLNCEVEKVIKVPLYYTGLKDNVKIEFQDGKVTEMNMSRDYSIELKVTVPAKDSIWYIFR